MNPFKAIIGGAYLLLASAWARLTQPRKMNKQGWKIWKKEMRK